MDRKTAVQIVRELKAANRPDLALAFKKSFAKPVTAKSNSQVVNELKQMGILPQSENAASYPEIGQDETWESLYTYSTAAVKKKAIAKCLKAKKPALANVAARIPTKAQRARRSK